MKLLHKIIAIVLPFIGFAAFNHTIAHGGEEHPYHKVANDALHDMHASKNYLFIENKGQWSEQVLYKAKLLSGSMFLEKNRFTYNFYDNAALMRAHANPTVEPTPWEDLKVRYHAFRVNFVDALPHPEMKVDQPGAGYYNYYIGRDRSKWASKVKGYQKATYQSIYDFIDLSLYTKDEFLKYDFIVHPHGDAEEILMNYEGVDKIYIKRGSLHIQTSVNKIIEQKPYAYQIINGQEVEVPCEFHLEDNNVSFVFPEGYNDNKTLIIDPTLIFSSSSGSFADNFGMTATYDDEGNLISGGMVYNDGFPYTTGAYDTTFAGTPGTGITDVILTKYDTDTTAGNNHIYSTYLGGVECETVHSLIVNSQGDLLLYGVTSSLDFPVTPNAYDTTFNGGTTQIFNFNGTNFNNGTDIYVAKLSEDGTALLGCTYIGGASNDGMNYSVSGGIYNSVAAYDSLTTNYGDQFRGEIILDNADGVYVASSTKSNDFPIVNGFGTLYGGRQAGVVFKFNDDLSNLEWSTYLSGSNMDAAYGIKVGVNGTVYVVGGTTSNDFPSTPGSLNPSYIGGKTDGYVAEISFDGTSLIRSTFIGTADYDQTYFVELGIDTSIYVYGQTLGTTTYPVVGGVYSNANSGQYITKLTEDLGAITWSTIFGSGTGVVDISPAAFLVDLCGNIYCTGWGANILQATPLSNMPVTGDAYQGSPPNGFDFYLAVFERDASGLLYGSYFGGPNSQEHVDGGTSRFDKNGVVYQSVCANCGGNDDFPFTPNAYSQVNNSTNCNNGIFKFDFGIIPTADFTVNNIEGCQPLTVNFSNNSSLVNSTFLWDFGNGDTTSIDFSPTRIFPDTGTYVVTLTILDTVCNILDTALQIITVHPQLQLATSGDTIVCTQDPLDIWVNTFGTTDTYVWSSNNNFTDTLNNITDSVLTVTPSQTPTYYYVYLGTQFCSMIDSVLVEYQPLAASMTPSDTAGCAPLSIDFTNNNTGATNYLWDFGNNDTTSTEFSPTRIFPEGTHTVYLIAYNSNCNGSDTIQYTITVHPEVSVTTSNDTVICTPVPVPLWANSNGTSSTYIWSSNNNFTDTLNNPITDSTIVVNPTVPTWYYVMVQNQYCQLIDSVLVDFASSQIEVDPNQTICDGQVINLSATNLNPGDPITYDWAPDAEIISGDGTATITVNPSTTTTFYVTAISSLGCVINDSIVVDVVNFGGLVDAFADIDSIPVGGSTNLHALPDGYNYLWFPPTGLDDPTSQDPLATPEVTTTYYVTITDTSGLCTRTDSVTIYVIEQICGDPDIYVPNAFSPNKDGQNDMLYVRGNNIEELYFTVYNRWGQMVFETRDQSIGWDGIFKGMEADPAVYVYYLEATCIGKETFFKKGNITLIR